jgi:hypothetical protein
MPLFFGADRLLGYGSDAQWLKSAIVQVSRTAASRNHPRFDDRGPRSAKARNRGPEGARVRRRDLWGFEECERQFSRGRYYGRTAI